jgi:hypothetical protein
MVVDHDDYKWLPNQQLCTIMTKVLTIMHRNGGSLGNFF